MIVPAVTIGLLEDELPQAEVLVLWLREAGYVAFHCDTGKAFIAQLRCEQPDMVILDWHLPDCEGIDVLQHIRNDLGYSGPAMFATARESEDDIVRGLAAGADDYLVKPVRRAELLARLEALWRRSGKKTPAELRLGPIKLDLENRQPWVGGELVKLTPTEFDLAVCVLQHEGELLSREFLLKEVWGVDANLDTRTVDVHISLIRRLLQIGPNMGYCIKTVYRHGYRLEAL